MLRGDSGRDDEAPLDAGLPEAARAPQASLQASRSESERTEMQVALTPNPPNLVTYQALPAAVRRPPRNTHVAHTAYGPPPPAETTHGAPRVTPTPNL